MYVGQISCGLSWGIISGYSLVRALECILVLCTFSHSLFARGEKGPESGDRVRTGGILALMLTVTLYLIFFTGVLTFGFWFATVKAKVDYLSAAGSFSVVTGIAIFVSCLSAARNRLVIARRISHGYDYGGERMWTKILKF